MYRSLIRGTRSAIIGLLLLLATWSNVQSSNGLQYQPIEVYANGDDCALILNGPGRTNVFDYTYNLLRGSFPPTAGSQTCITYDAVNRAYIEARKRINVAQPKSKTWRPEDLATVGELLLDITTNLAQTYGLTVEEIEKSLPLIDTSKTLIREVCPAFLSNVECRAGKYRRNDGLCTNLKNPTWGSTLAPFQRLMPPRFSDGLTAPRISVTGHDLPLSRVVSRTMHPDEGYHDHAGTVMVIAWGQFMDHDYTLTGTPLDPLNRNDPEECCHRPPHLKNPYCNEILIPEDDYFYRLFKVKCMDFVRAFPAVRPGCRLGSRVPFNLLTGVLDGNTVYGITDAFARKLRTGYGGLLRMNQVFSEYGLKDLLPLKLDIPDEGCTRPNRSMYCFEAGEIRVNEQLVLTCMHTLMAREHNRIAKTLIQVNPHWDDETLYQEARRIVIAEIQHITYNEFLPILLGKDVMEKFGLLLEKNDYWDGYDESINPSVIDAFAAAAFRFGHSLLPTAVERWSKAHKFIASKRLSDLIRRPFDLYRAGVFDEYIMGLMNQVAQAMDDSITQEVTNHLFKKAGAKFGLDLVSFNMQRGREFGIPSYMEFRKFCGLPWVDTFEELHGSMPNETIKRYSSIFEHPADVDLWSGGVSERPLPGSMLGPTFACVIATQFSYSRRGDRFWYELPNQPSSFTLEQLNEIRKVKLARVICDNTDLIDTIQIYPMVLPDHEINPRVPCRSGILPSMDLSKWAEYPTGSHAQYHVVNEQTRSHLVDRTPVKKLKKARQLSKKSGKEYRKSYRKYVASVTESRNTGEKVAVVDTKDSTVASIDTERRSNLIPTNVTKVEFKAHRDQEHDKRSKIALKRAIRSAEGKRTSNDTSTKFYRHPNLSYEEQQKRFNAANQPKNVNFVLSGALKERAPVRIDSGERGSLSTSSRFNDTDLSQADDMVKTTEPSSRNGSGSEESDDDDATSIERSKVDETSRIDRRNETYINIRDHQKVINETSDIPDYDPNKIPYVEVPDYSDIREESLDEVDREAGKRKKANETGNVVDFVDPGTWTNHDEPYPSLNTDELEDSNEHGSSQGSKHNPDGKRRSNTNFNELSKWLNVNESAGKSLDNSSTGDKPNANVEHKKHFKLLKINDSKRNNDKLSTGSKHRANKKNEWSSPRIRELTSADELVRPNEKEIRGAVESTESVIFDVNEYRKPFDLDEFLKDDPIMKKLESLEKETLPKYVENGKRVSAGKSDNTPVERAAGPSRHSAATRDDDDNEDNYFTKLRESSVPKDAREDARQESRNDGNTSDDDAHFPRFFFERWNKNEKGPLAGFRGKQRFPSTRFTGDLLIRNSQEDKRTDADDATGRSDAKNRASLWNDDIDIEIEAGDEPELMYKNFWSLEYKSPRERVDMDAQERKK